MSMDSWFPNPHDKDIAQLEEGLAYRAIKSGNNWILPSGKNAANGDPVVLDGVFGYATAAIVGGTDAIVEDTNWKPYGDGGAIGAIIGKSKPIPITTQAISAPGGTTRTEICSVADIQKYKYIVIAVAPSGYIGNFYIPYLFPVDIFDVSFTFDLLVRQGSGAIDFSRFEYNYNGSGKLTAGGGSAGIIVTRVYGIG